MIDLLPGVALPRPAPRPTRDRWTSVSTTSSRRASAGCSPTTRPSRRCAASTPRTTTSATAAGSGSSTRSPPIAPTWPRSRRSTTRASRASARFERDLEVHNLRYGLFEADVFRRWERTGTATDAIGDGVFLLFARGAAPMSERLERIADRLELAPAYIEASKSRLVGAPVRTWLGVEARTADELPTMFAEILDVSADQPRETRAGAAATRDRGHQRGARRLHRLAAGGDDRRHRRLAPRRGALRRARPAASVRRPRRGRDPRDRDRPAPLEPRGASRGGPRARPGRGLRDRARAPQGRPPGHVRGGARRLPGRDAPRAGARHRPRDRDDPRGRARRGHRDARVPARGDALRRVLRAGPVRRRPAGAVHRHPVHRRRLGRDARALLGVDLATRASTRPTRATTCSSRSPPATRASPGCSPTRPSSPRAGACTASR